MFEEVTPTAPLPPQPTSFVGRAAEREALIGLLSDPACRLVTLAGPGGIGKTRLALAVAEQLQGAFARGVAFASLQAVPDTDHLPQALADAVGCPPPSQGDSSSHLLDFLRRRELLLVVDNFEHLLAGTPLLSDLLATAPGVRLLVTSRVALNVQEEWRFPLEGLGLPRSEAGAADEPSDALRLFGERARRARSSFVLADEYAASVRICQLVGGLPLAIELAAAWTKSLPCTAIAEEIARNLAFLETSLRNLPPRHRSMRAAFDSSWQLLTPEERDALSRFAIFRGGFRREAAARVAGAALPVLASLLDKSLVRYEADGRYHLHELLRQYAEEHLLAIPGAAEQVAVRHKAYYLDFLAECYAGMWRGDQVATAAAILAELDNIRVALPGAIDGADPDIVRRGIEALAIAVQCRSLYREGIGLLSGVVARLRAAPPTMEGERTLAAALVGLGWLLLRVGQLAEARAVLVESRDCLERHGVPPTPGQASDPELGLAVLALVDGDYAEATRLGERARERSERHRLVGNLPYAWYAIANAAFAEGRYDEAQGAARQAQVAAEHSKDRWFLAYCLNVLGQIAHALGAYEDARRYFEGGYTLREEFDDPEGMAVALTQLGRVAAQQGERAEARKLLERARTLYDDLGDRGGLAATLHALGDVAAAAGEPQAARQSLARALRLASEIGFRPLVLAILASLAGLALEQGEPGRAATLATLVRAHPAADRAVTERTRHTLALAEAQLPAAGFQLAAQQGQRADLDAVVRQLLADLDAPADPLPESAPLPHQAAVSPADGETLVEPLTPRESEILHLVASGHTNQAIADRLYLSLNTVKWHSSRIFGKLGVESRTQALIRARELRLVD